MSISLVTHGYLSRVTTTETQPSGTGPATIIAGPSGVSSEENVPVSIDSDVVNFVPGVLGSVAGSRTPSAVDSDTSGLVPGVLDSATFVPVPVSVTEN